MLGRASRRAPPLLLTIVTLALLSAHTLSAVAWVSLSALLAALGVAAALLDELDAWLLSRTNSRLVRRVTFWLPAALPAVVGAYLIVKGRQQFPWWTLLCLGAPILVLAGSAKLRRNIPAYPPNWTLVLLALLAWVHANEATLVSVRAGAAVLHLGLYVALWGGTLVLCEASALRFRARASSLSAALLLLVGVCMHELDRRLFVGLYASVHGWLGAAAFLLLYTGYTTVACKAHEHWPLKWYGSLRQWASAVLLLAAVAAPLTLGLGAGSRASLARSPGGATLLRLLPRAEATQTSTANHGALHYEKYLDSGPRNRSNILLVTVDALRADAVESAPNLRELAHNAFDFRRAYCQGSRTSIGMAALMAGRYSANMRWELWPYTSGRIFDPAKTSAEQLAKLGNRFVYTTMPKIRSGDMLAERLRKAGYTTMAVPYAADNHFFKKGTGFDRGFDSFVDLTRKKWRAPTSKRISNKGRQLIKKNQASPWFLWVHYYDPHEARRSSQRYKSLTRQFDKAFGMLIRELERQSQFDNTIIAVTGDHGEAFGEHGHFEHATSLYDEQVLVPLVLRVPGMNPVRSDIAVATIDLTATLLALAGADTSRLDGVNLTAVERAAGALRRRPIFTELHRYRSNQGKRTTDLKAVVRGDLKLIFNRLTNIAELYDLAKDPKELDNLVDQSPRQLPELSAILRAFLAQEESTKSLP